MSEVRPVQHGSCRYKCNGGISAFKNKKNHKMDFLPLLFSIATIESVAHLYVSIKRSR